jgi:hexosaminidase
MLTIRRKFLKDNLYRAINEIKNTLPLNIGDSGINIEVRKSDVNSFCFFASKLVIEYRSYSYIFRALRLFIQNGCKEITVKENCIFDNLGVMADCSRNAVLKPEAVKKLIRLLAVMGYNTLQLYTEDTYEVNDEPYFGYLRGRYTKKELREIDAYAKLFGIELVPCVQTLAHLNAITRWQPYSDIIDCNDILLADSPKTYKLIENIFSTLAECFSSVNVNIGMDEAHMLGLGRYKDLHGIKDRAQIMINHLKKVHEIAESYGFKCSMWSDMFFRLAFGGYSKDGEIPKKILKGLPRDVSLIYWDYYSTDTQHYDSMIKQHKKFPNKIIFAGGAWTWTGFTPHNGYSMQTIKASLNACKKNKIKDYFITMWGDNGGECSPFKVLPSLVFAAERAYGKNSQSNLKQSFELITGCKYNTFMSADLPNITESSKALNTNNPSKYILYNDCFSGIFDTLIAPKDKEIYLSHIKNLKKAEKIEAWGYLFKPLRHLCEVLYIKYDLGLKTRELYYNKDREGISELIENAYKPLLRKINMFYKAFLAYWNQDNKPHGFDVQDIRIGGLIQRIKHCMQDLADYANGGGAIQQLDEELLDFLGKGDILTKQSITFNNYNLNSTVNIL